MIPHWHVPHLRGRVCQSYCVPCKHFVQGRLSLSERASETASCPNDITAEPPNAGPPIATVNLLCLQVGKNCWKSFLSALLMKKQ